MPLKYVLALAISVVSAFALIPPFRSLRSSTDPTYSTIRQETVQILEDAFLLARVPSWMWTITA
jgi:hypothetical protein